jgi:hypothetical protein
MMVESENNNQKVGAGIDEEKRQKGVFLHLGIVAKLGASDF